MHPEPIRLPFHRAWFSCFLLREAFRALIGGLKLFLCLCGWPWLQGCLVSQQECGVLKMGPCFPFHVSYRPGEGIGVTPPSEGPAPVSVSSPVVLRLPEPLQLSRQTWGGLRGCGVQPVASQMGSLIPFATGASGRVGNSFSLPLGGREESGCLLPGRVVQAMPLSPACPPN